MSAGWSDKHLILRAAGVHNVLRNMVEVASQERGTVMTSDS